MARQIITDYVFNPKAGTITLNGVSGLTLAQITSIHRRNEGLYFASNARNASLVGNTLTLPKGTVDQSFSASDPLTITYDTNPGGASNGQLVQIEEPLQVSMLDSFAVRHDDDSSLGGDGTRQPVQLNSIGRLKVSSSPALLDPVIGNIGSAGAIVQIDVTRASNIVFYCTGTFTGVNATFEGSLDGTNWFGIQAVRSNSNTIDTTTGVLAAAPAYAWEASVNAYAFFRIRATAWASGTQSWRIVPGAYATEPIPAIATHPVTITSGTVTAVPTTSTATQITSTASTNISSIVGSASNLGEITIFNPTAAVVYVKLYNKATAPVLATDVPLMTIPVAVNALVAFTFPPVGKRLLLGLGIAITAGPLATDAVAVAAGVQVSLSRY